MEQLRQVLCSPCEELTPRDIESTPFLAGDRQGFKLTANNTTHRDAVDAQIVPKLDMEIYSDFDVCYIWPAAANDKKTMKLEHVEKALLQICRARVGKSVSELTRIDRLHPVYGLSRGDIREMTLQDFNTLLRTVFSRVLDHIGAHTAVEAGRDKNKNIYIRARLSEAGCQVVADYKGYPLQVDRECTRFKEFKNDAEFAPPFMVYERSIELHPRGTQAPRQIWQRYDRLSRRVYGVQSDNEEVSIFRDVDRIRLLRMALFEFLNIDLMVRDQHILSCFALKQPTIEIALVQNWASLKRIWSWQQPVDDIRAYFGEEIAMYFAWLAFYAKGLILPAVAGLFTLLFVTIFKKTDKPHHWVNLIRAVYCISLGVWSAVFNARWKRRENVLSLRWGVEQATISQSTKEESPWFKPERYVVNPARPDKFVRYFSPNKRRVRQIITTTVLVASTSIAVFLSNDDLNGMIYAKVVGVGHTGLESWVVSFLNPSAASKAAYIAVATSLCVRAYNALWSNLVSWRLGVYENHQHLQDYNDTVQFKLFVFEVANIFATLYYLAFLKASLQGCDGTDGSCIPELSKQLTSFYALDFIGSVISLIAPYASYAISKTLAKPEENMPAYQYQAYLSGYYSAGSEDFMDKIIQFGYTALFSVAQPILPLLGMLVNMVQLRTDALKLCKVYRRPFPRQADTIGTWDDLQRAMTFFGIISNVFLCCFATVGTEHSTSTRLTACLIMTLSALALKDYVEYKLPGDSPRYRLMKTRMQVVDYEALWGNKSLGIAKPL